MLGVRGRVALGVCSSIAFWRADSNNPRFPGTPYSIIDPGKGTAPSGHLRGYMLETSSPSGGGGADKTVRNRFWARMIAMACFRFLRTHPFQDERRPQALGRRSRPPRSDWSCPRMLQCPGADEAGRDGCCLVRWPRFEAAHALAHHRLGAGRHKFRKSWREYRRI
jgi:hypothetical protein